MPVAIVTGGAGGIGAATVALLSERGYSVASIDLADFPGDDPAVLSIRADLTDEAAVNDAVATVVARFGGVDALVTSAAVLECFAVDDTPLEVWERVFAVNVRGTFLAAKACIPHLKRSDRAAIVALSSVHAIASVRRTAAYAATKGAVIGLAGQMAVEYADDGIRVNSVVVGSVDTPMSTRHGQAIERDGLAVTAPAGRLGRMAQPREVAEAIAFLLSPEAGFVTGSALQADGGLLNRLM